MLLRDIPPTKARAKVLARREKYSSRRKVALGQKSLPSLAPEQKATNKTVSIKRSPAHLSSKSKAKAPLWLQSLLVLNHGSAFFCYLTVAAALVMYGMTVYAPKLWTQKYSQLQDLQKQERQFTSVDEVFKDELAQSASKSDSGFIKPNLTQPPIFLPSKQTKAIELKESTTAPTKIINPVSPIAY